MTETRPVQSAQSTTGASAPTPDRRHLQADTLARFQQALSAPTPGVLETKNSPALEQSGKHTSATENDEHRRRDPNASTPGDVERRDLNAVALADIGRHDLNSSESERHNLIAPTVIRPERNQDSSTTNDRERRDLNSLASAMPATVGSLHYSMPVTQATPGLPTMASGVEAARLIEQATSLLVERASRADASRFIVSLDHAIVGGASAEFVRDGAFLRVRLTARNDAAFRSMWTNRVELEERLAASTGLVTRVEISEGYGDGRSA